MTNSKILFEKLIQALNLDESDDEIQAIVFEVLNHFGISRTDVLSQKPVDLNFNNLLPIIGRLNNHEPVQYVLGEAWFCGHKFFVNSSVLIPRPETEQLVEEVLKINSTKNEFSILDIGTGSGCIAISLSLMFPQAKTWAIDVSSEALSMAKKNARQLNARVNFVNQNILNDPLSNQTFDLIVSNPPYISSVEKNSISKNVVDYEPHLALFVDEPDPLIFYRAIANVAIKSLNPGGQVLVEINERFGPEIKSIFRSSGLSECKIIKDLSGKDRIVSAGKV